MSQQEEKPQDKEPGLAPADPTLDNLEVRDTIAASREALQKSSEEIERAKRLLRETEQLQSPPGSQPDEKAI